VHGGFAPPRGDTAKNAARRVLVTAASGGVGIWVIQLARLAGVGEIIGTCGPANLELVKTLGAHEAVNYMKHKDLSVWVDNRGCGKFDVVIDAVGGAGLEQAWICVKERGLLISIVTPPHAKKPYHGVEKDVNGLFFIVEADASQLKEITGLLERGECRAVVDTEYRLEDYINAFERLQGGHLTGKVVLNL
jgi:NADPH:quinone reductase-like Zn-dependent oxidoreductase